ncbi:MAG: transglycosylase SLT domain-containing protein [Thermodesulfovibrionales bacterium]
MKRVLTIILLFIAVSLACGSETDAKGDITHLKKGKELLDIGEYSEALESLKTAYKDLPVIGDYTLFFMSKACNKLERFDDSSYYIDELLRTYPDSLLKKKARALKVNNLLSNCSRDRKCDEAIKSLEQYVTDYPEDEGMSLLFGKLLKGHGEVEKAKKVFRRIYTGSSAYSELAYQELQPSDITTVDMLTRASNLIRTMEYRKAEDLLRKAIHVAGGQIRHEMQRKLGLTLFRQKRYREAADVFLKAGDVYNGARAFYRAGDLDSFNDALSKLISMDDRRAGALLIAYASKKRRDGDMMAAMEIYNDVKQQYPSYLEDALWGIAWAYYRNSEYQKAAGLLKELSGRYPNPKYFYWKQRCIEQEAQTSSFLGQRKFKDFYSLLSQIGDMDNLSRASIRPASGGSWTLEPKKTSRFNGLPPSEVLISLERFNILMELGMRDNAIDELIRASNRFSQPDVIRFVSRKLQEVGAYKRSINVALKLPEEAEASDILYPMAYWPTVKDAAGRYRLDPFIILSIIREESRFDPDARSISGALGLMQIIPTTAYSLERRLRINISEKAAIHDIRINITLGAYYLSSLLKEFGSLPMALAAYNAGEDKVREWVKIGNYKSSDEFIEDIPFDETRNYVKRVLMTYAIYLDMSSKE